MKRVVRGTMVAGAFVLALVGGSCASSNMLDSTQGDVNFQIASTSTSSTYPWAHMLIGQMSFSPTSAGGALGDPLAMLPTASSVDLNSSFSVPPLRVTAQAYELNAFQVGFELNIVNSQPVGVGTTGTCNGSVLETLRTKTPNDDSTIVPTCDFTVRTGSSTPINVTVDTAGLTALLVSKYNCATNVYTPPTSAELLPFLQFQCGP